MSDAATQPAESVAAARVVGAVKIYGSGETEVRALDNVDITFERGCFTAIMGPSGSGKSTLMHCMAALDDLTEGQAFIGDTDLSTLSDRELTRLRRDRLGFVFQAFNLVPTLTAIENITLPMDLARREPDREWVDSVIATMGLGDRLAHRPNELSGGQQQRVALSRALASKAEIIFADEPSGNLDSRSGTDVMRFMRQAVDDLGRTVVMVTHDVKAASYADRAVFLGDGSLRGEMLNPTAVEMLDYIKILQVGHFVRSTPGGATMDEVLEFMEDMDD
ncbi:ABC transporter ATP-binding protein [Candidatus Poriferisodalis sp.]|uniref:ABC transporter ATP-binding protein n=1 Tax=Candidatus Poriferisodalis sp. TaxID=3101277 RepID=UPI003C6FF087